LLPFGPLSESIDYLSVEADKSKNAVLKSLALFLSMTLYGDVEKHVLSAYQPSLLFAERQCVLDTLAYAQFYLPILAQSLKVPKSSPSARELIRGILGEERLQLIQTWLKVVASREPSLSLDLDYIENYMVQALQGTPQEVVHRLIKLYHADLPDQIILLVTSPEDLALRLKEKKATTSVAEIHEQSEALMGLSAALNRSAELLKTFKPSLVVHELNTEKMTIDQTIHSIFHLAEQKGNSL
jgi:hypothetical protein